jgi:outer membrane cobalamin receptor
MFNYQKLCFLLFFSPILCIGQTRFTVSGYVEDDASGERLISASVINKSSRSGILTNNFGYFSLAIDPKNADGTSGNNREVALSVSFIGYETQQITLTQLKDTTLVVKLKAGKELEAVEINAKKQNRIDEQVQMSQITIPIQQIKRMPMILGEADVLKALQFLPGVKAGAEGTAGINVRGGSSDQNLFLLDGVPVYNPTHIGGLFSIFNADALRNVSIIKGGFPARFGGRLSSVIEVDTKDGNKKEHHGNANVGLLSARLTLEGPILKDRVSYMFSARRTYLDLALSPVLNRTEVIGGSTTETKRDIAFYDINGKVNARLSDKHNLFLSIYQGADVFYTNVKQSFSNSVQILNDGFDFKNQVASLRWNWQLSNKLFANTTAYYTRYNLNFQSLNDDKIAGFKPRREYFLFKTAIEDVALKTDFDYNLNANNRLRFGASTIQHRFLPNRLFVQSTGQRDTTLGANYERANESDIYVEDEINWGKLKVNMGVRATLFNSKNNLSGGIQPRLSANYSLPANTALKLSYNRSNQFIHTLTNDALGLPTDSWIPSVAGVKPALAEQVAVGLVKSIGDKYEISVEAYYKTMDNLVAYREGTGFLNANPIWELNVVQGSGKAQGLEFFVQKKEGKLTGWISYTLAKATRQFEDINDGKAYRYKYDRRHEFAIIANYQLSKKIALSANWTFATGNPITLPNSVYNLPIPQFPNNIDILTIIDYAPRNSYVTRDIHRLDVGIEFYKKRKKYERRWNFGLYNAYNHANPFYFYFVRSSDSKASGATSVRYSIKQNNLLPILPAISYDIKF